MPGFFHPYTVRELVALRLAGSNRLLDCVCIGLGLDFLHFQNFADTQKPICGARLSYGDTSLFLAHAECSI